ncbi:cellulose biosynthesis cyclic di-GMP-binding regulatory protein BcsB [Rhodobium gokarnense]|uniref:Cyclic di-GMP-binding protein n=1 Tax=Rhodobium gokarnense TaxID=364296 RepID=A0ABT3HBF8_9HYPH|nr:cellulose biosynthesis cyclic di-GMP-binding regulatory protein BcsB [Rhodobium gokarnense]MCW2307720.1 hypothetical protein [Rhodobium gokarnense]
MPMTWPRVSAAVLALLASAGAAGAEQPTTQRQDILPAAKPLFADTALRRTVGAAGAAEPTTQRHDPPAADAVKSPRADATLQRTISLSELGFAQGIELTGLSGVRDLYFPIPRPSTVDSLRLLLPYRSAAAFESRRYVKVSVADRPRLTRPLGVEERSGEIEILIDRDVVQNGFVHVRIEYSGAMTDDRCVDERLSGAYLSLAPAGGIIATLNRDALTSVADVAAMMPRDLDIVIPSTPSEAQAAAALALVAGNPNAALATTARAPAGGRWRRGRIVLDGRDAPALQARGGAMPSIALGGDDPLAAAHLLQSRWRALATSPEVDRLHRSDRSAPDRLDFSDLGSDPAILQVVDRGSWTVSLPVTRVPPGKRISGMVVDMSVAGNGGKTPPVVSVTMNGLLLASVVVQDRDRVRLDVDLPSGLMTTSNSVEISAVRQVRGGDCTHAPQGYDAQLLPSSHFVLGDAGPVDDFFELGPHFAEGVTVVLQDPAMLGGTARLLRGLLDERTPVRVRYRSAPTEGPYVWVSDTAPPQGTPAIRFDAGPVRLADTGGAVLMDGAVLQSQTAVQLLAADGRQVLWIRPGTSFDEPVDSAEPPELGLGNVAFLDRQGISLAFSTKRDRLIQIRYPDAGGLAQYLEQYRLGMIGGGWLIATVGFVLLLRGISRARRSKG